MSASRQAVLLRFADAVHSFSNNRMHSEGLQNEHMCFGPLMLPILLGGGLWCQYFCFLALFLFSLAMLLPRQASSATLFILTQGKKIKDQLLRLNVLPSFQQKQRLGRRLC